MQAVDDKIALMDDLGRLVEQQAQQLVDLEQVIPGVSPGAVLEAMDDPEMFAQIARGDLYVQMAILRQSMAHPRIGATQRMEYAKFLAKMGKVDNPANDGAAFANVPMISIVLPNSGTGVTIASAAPAQPVEREVFAPDAAVLP